MPGIPVPSTAKSRAASRVAGWKTVKYATVVSADEVYRQRLSRIESGSLGMDSDREEIRKRQREIELCERRGTYFEAHALRFALQEFVFSLGKRSEETKE